MTIADSQVPDASKPFLSHAALRAARQLGAKDQLDAALLEYRRTVEFDPANRQAAEKTIQLERTIRDRIEASRPRPPIAEIREQARLCMCLKKRESTSALLERSSGA